MTPAKMTQSRLRELETGQVPSRTLAEALAIDHGELLKHTLVSAPAGLVQAVEDVRGAGILSRMRTVGAALRAHLTPDEIAALTEHPSDTVRGWVCFAIATPPHPADPETLISSVYWAATDPHFAVREWVWMAVRAHLSSRLDQSIPALAALTAHESDGARRFASETLRPRGVWAAHITELKEQPERALAILEPLRGDPSRYVQDSVANWLNDAAKTRPDWVDQVTKRWSEGDVTAATRRIITRGRRSFPETMPTNILG